MYFLNLFGGWDKKFFSIYDLTGENFYDEGGVKINTPGALRCGKT